MLLFELEGSIVPIIYPKIILGGLFGALACILDYYDISLGRLAFKFTPFTSFGVALSLFLGFRNKVCYDRWWEARNLWGRHIIAVRNLARILQSVPHSGDNLKCVRKIIRCSSAHSYALRNQLRKTPNLNAERNSYLDREDMEAMVDCPNPADMVLIIASRALNRLSGQRTRSRKNIHPLSLRAHFATFDNEVSEDSSIDCESEYEKPEVPLDSIILAQVHTHLSEMGTVQGACERISNCYIPLPYTLLINRTVWLFVILSAFALIQDCRYFTPFVTAIIAYVFFGLHEVGLQLEDPFTLSPYSLALNAMCRTNEISVAMALGEKPPPPLEPDGVVLM